MDMKGKHKRETQGTHKSMGKVSNSKAGLESGVSEVQSYHAGKGVEVNEGTQRPRRQKNGSVSMK